MTRRLGQTASRQPCGEGASSKVLTTVWEMFPVKLPLNQLGAVNMPPCSPELWPEWKKVVRLLRTVVPVEAGEMMISFFSCRQRLAVLKVLGSGSLSAPGRAVMERKSDPKRTGSISLARLLLPGGPRYSCTEMENPGLPAVKTAAVGPFRYTSCMNAL